VPSVAAVPANPPRRPRGRPEKFRPWLRPLERLITVAGKSVYAVQLADVAEILRKNKLSESKPALEWHQRAVINMDLAAAVLGVSTPTLYRLSRDGDLKMVKVGGRTAITTDSIQAFLDRVRQAGWSASDHHVQATQSSLRARADRLAAKRAAAAAVEEATAADCTVEVDDADADDPADPPGGAARRNTVSGQELYTAGDTAEGLQTPDALAESPSSTSPTGPDEDDDFEVIAELRAETTGIGLRVVREGGEYWIDVASPFDGEWLQLQKEFGADLSAAIEYLHDFAGDMSPEWVRRNFPGSSK
jgi:excisionase family DNA binding protein